VTPLTKNFLSPSKKNFAAGRILEFVACVMSSEVETSLDVFLALDGETRSAFAQTYDGASDFAVGCLAPKRLAAQFFKVTAFVFGGTGSPLHAD
jgi:hypothetical protein